MSAPSVYQKLKQGVVDGSDRVSAFVLEYDRRFASYGDDFIFYDYNEPLSLPASVAPQSFDIVLADPPYLSEECLSKVAKTIKYLSKGKVLLCTGDTLLYYQVPDSMVKWGKTKTLKPESGVETIIFSGDRRDFIVNFIVKLCSSKFLSVS